MAPCYSLVTAVALGFIVPISCNERPVARKSPDSEVGPAPGNATVEHIDPEERAAAARLVPAKDPVQEKTDALRMDFRQAYNNRRFDELEKSAAEVRSSKEVTGSGSWKLVQLYSSLACDNDEPESMWQLHDRIHQDWIAAWPQSITSRVAHADFLVEYAWQARGSGYSHEVTADGWRRFRERLAAARKVLEDARPLPEKDPYWWLVALHVARGQEWTKAEYEALIEEAKAFEPKFWGYDTERAFSLLPRWYGKPGEWEAYAESAAARLDGLGDEVYARIVTYLRGYHENVFRDSKASWPKTRSGLEQMRKRYPDSLEVLSNSAMLATMAEDRALAKEMFDKLGDTYLPYVWRKPERFVHYRHWAETGKW